MACCPGVITYPPWKGRPKYHAVKHGRFLISIFWSFCIAALFILTFHIHLNYVGLTFDICFSNLKTLQKRIVHLVSLTDRNTHTSGPLFPRYKIMQSMKIHAYKLTMYQVQLQNAPSVFANYFMKTCKYTTQYETKRSFLSTRCKRWVYEKVYWI